MAISKPRYKHLKCSADSIAYSRVLQYQFTVANVLLFLFNHSSSLVYMGNPVHRLQINANASCGTHVHLSHPNG